MKPVESWDGSEAVAPTEAEVGAIVGLELVCVSMKTSLKTAVMSKQVSNPLN